MTSQKHLRKWTNSIKKISVWGSERKSGHAFLKSLSCNLTQFYFSDCIVFNKTTLYQGTIQLAKRMVR